MKLPKYELKAEESLMSYLKAKTILCSVYMFLFISLCSFSQNTITNDFFGIEPIPLSPVNVEKIMPVLNELNAGVIGVNAFRWDYIQTDSASYNWNVTDTFMKLFHDNSFMLQINIICIAGWAGMTQHEFPPPEDTSKFRTFIHDFAERYNGDGNNDAPGINSNVIKILNIGSEIENSVAETPGHWHGTAEEYAILQKMLYEEVKSVEPSIIVARGASNFGWIADDLPDTTTLMYRYEFWKNMHNHFTDTTAFQNNADYELFGFHFNHYYSGIIPMTEFLRKIMQDSGIDMAFYSEDTRSAMVNANVVAPGYNISYEFYEDTDSNGVPDILDTLQNWPTTSPEYKSARKRYYSDQAILLVKKLTVGLKAGLNPIIISTFTDFPHYHMVQWRHSGLIDAAEMGQNFDSINTLAAKKPAFFTYKHYIKNIVGHDSDVKQLGFGDNLWAFKFTKPDTSTFIIWYEDIYSPDKLLDTVISLKNYTSSDSVLVTTIITEIGDTLPQTFYSSADSILIGYQPIFVTIPSSANTIKMHNDRNNLLKIYPNPSKGGKFTAEITWEEPEGANIIIQIYDSRGVMVYQTQIKKHQTVINLNLSSGFYFYIMKEGETYIETGKIVVI